MPRASGKTTKLVKALIDNDVLVLVTAYKADLTHIRVIVQKELIERLRSGDAAPVGRDDIDLVMRRVLTAEQGLIGARAYLGRSKVMVDDVDRVLDALFGDVVAATFSGMS